MRVLLLGIQAEIQPESYRTAESFRRRVLALTRRALADVTDGAPRVIAFPEAFALPLLFWLDTPESTREGRGAAAAALQLLKGDWRGALRLATRRRLPSPSVFYHLRAGAVWPVYEEVFREAAREAGAYLVAGSLFAPLVDWEPSKRWHAHGRPVYNLTLVFSPAGAILARVPKLQLTDDEARGFLSPGPFGTHVVETSIGKIATLICFDAFHESLIERVDAAGAWLLVQPSANAARWDGPWSADARQVEGEVWMREGLVKKLAGRENLRYGINPMLNGSLYDIHFEGRSSIAAPGRFLDLAALPTGDALVRAEVEVGTGG